MKKAVCSVFVALFVLAAFAGSPLKTRAFTAQLDALQVNSAVYGQAPNLQGAKGFGINQGDRVYILGWIAFTKSDGLREIKYKINGKEFPCSDTYRDRPDVAGAGITVYNNGKHAGYGYDDNFMELTGIGSLDPGTYTLTLTAYSNGGAVSDFNTFTLTVSSNETACLEALQINASSYTGSENKKDASRITLSGGDSLYMLGWASFSTLDQLSEVIYEADGQNYKCTGDYVDRPDVAKAGIPVYGGGEHAGFGSESKMMELTGISSLPAGMHTVVIRAISRSGKSVAVKTFTLRVTSVLPLGDPGDFNGDGKINGQDLVRLRKYLDNYDEETGTSTIELKADSEVTGDGITNAKDLVRLRKYLDNYDDETNTSSVMLIGSSSSQAYPTDDDNYAGTPPYTVNGDTITVGGVTYPNTADMRNGVTYALDDLGRELTLETDGYTYDGTKNVGLFYFLWLGEHGDYGIYDITKILERGGQAAGSPSYSGWGAVGAMHFWGEPLYGYYFSKDKWVMRKHIEELTLAGVDFLYIDATNGFPYINNALALMSVMHEFNEQGFTAPKIVFYTHSSCAATVSQLYNSIYKPGKYSDTWLYVDGKPLIIAYQDDCRKSLSSAAYGFFSYREPQWPNENQKQNGWPWMDFTYPQRIFVNSKGKNESISVSVAQHNGTVCFSDSAIYGNRSNCGRSFHNGAADTAADSALYGFNFSQQFERAIQANVPYVLVTGWNEWVAQRQDPNTGGRNNQVVFVDTCTMEYSRDIEPMKGGYFDNYYMLLTDWIRKYKGAAPVIVRDARKRIDISGSFSQWDSVTAYTDPSGDVADRNSKGFGNKTLTDTSGNNDIVTAKVIYDTKYIYFYAKTAKNISAPASGASWMQLFLNADFDGYTGFYGFDYVVNYETSGTGITTLAKCERSGDTYKVVSTEYIAYKAESNEIMIRVPLASIGVRDYNDIMIAFKWVDSDTKITTMEQMYSQGDAAPIGRMCYTFQNHK